jgi:hypothetical protein
VALQDMHGRFQSEEASIERRLRADADALRARWYRLAFFPSSFSAPSSHPGVWQ